MKISFALLLLAVVALATMAGCTAPALRVVHAHASPACNSTRTVWVNRVSGVDSLSHGSSAVPVRTLRYAVSRIESPGWCVMMAAGSYVDSSPTPVTLSSSIAPLVIRGADTMSYPIIDCGHAAQAFHVEGGGEFWFEYLKIQHCGMQQENTVDDRRGTGEEVLGGAIVSDGATVYLSRSVITHNVASRGGGIAALGGALVIGPNVFLGNNDASSGNENLYCDEAEVEFETPNTIAGGCGEGCGCESLAYTVADPCPFPCSGSTCFTPCSPKATSTIVDVVSPMAVVGAAVEVEVNVVVSTEEAAGSLLEGVATVQAGGAQCEAHGPFPSRCNLHFPAAGEYAVVASFTATMQYLASTAPPSSIVIGKGRVVISAVVDRTPSVFGESVGIGVSLVPPAAGTVAVSGIVVITAQDDGTAQCSFSAPAFDSQGTCLLPIHAVGDVLVSVVYAGDDNYESATTSLVQPVTHASTSIVVIPDEPMYLVQGEPAMIEAEISVLAPGGGFPDTDPIIIEASGPIVSDCVPAIAMLTPGGGSVQQQLPGGSMARVSCKLRFPVAGEYVMNAAFGGTAAHAASISSTVPVHVALPPKRAAFIALLSQLNQETVVGQALKVSFSMQVVSEEGVEPEGLGSPSGNVVVTAVGDDALTTSCRREVVSGDLGRGECELVFTSGGRKLVTATYLGSALFNGSISNSIAHRVLPASTRLSYSINADDPLYAGDSMLVNASLAVIAPGAGDPSGVITTFLLEQDPAELSVEAFDEYAQDKCVQSVTDGSSRVLCELVPRSGGTFYVVVFYGPDEEVAISFLNSTSDVTPVEPRRRRTALFLDSVSDSVLSAGESFSAFFTVSPRGSLSGPLPPPSGSVTVYAAQNGSLDDSGLFLCTAAVGTGDCMIRMMRGGLYIVSAQYSGDDTYSASETQDAARVAVERAPCEIAVDSTYSYSVVGARHTFRYELRSLLEAASDLPFEGPTDVLLFGETVCDDIAPDHSMCSVSFHEATAATAADEALVIEVVDGTEDAPDNRQDLFHRLHLEFVGDDVFLPASLNTSHAVIRADTLLTLIVPPDLYAHELAEISAEVTIVPPGRGRPVGELSIHTDTGDKCVGSAPRLDCSIPFGEGGPEVLRAEYSGTNDLKGSTATATIDVRCDVSADCAAAESCETVECIAGYCEYDPLCSDGIHCTVDDCGDDGGCRHTYNTCSSDRTSQPSCSASVCEESTGECIEVEFVASDSEECDSYSAVDQLEATAALQQSGQLTLEQALGELLEIVDSMHPNGDADENMKTVAVAIESFIQMYTPETSPSYVATVLAADVLLSFAEHHQIVTRANLLRILDIAEEVAHQGTAFVDAFSSSSSLFPNLLDVSGVTFLGLDMQNRDSFFLTGGPSDFQSAASSRSMAIVETIEREAIARIPSLRRVAFSGQYVELRAEYSAVRGASSRSVEVDEFCESAVVVSGFGEPSSEHVISTIVFGVGVNPHAVDQPKSQGDHIGSDIVRAVVYDANSLEPLSQLGMNVAVEAPVPLVRQPQASDAFPVCNVYEERHARWSPNGCGFVEFRGDIESPCMVCQCSDIGTYAVLWESVSSSSSGLDDTAVVLIVVLSLSSALLAILVAVIAVVVIWNLQSMRTAIRERRRLRIAQLMGNTRSSSSPTADSSGKERERSEEAEGAGGRMDSEDGVRCTIDAV